MSGFLEMFFLSVTLFSVLLFAVCIYTHCVQCAAQKSSKWQSSFFHFLLPLSLFLLPLFMAFAGAMFTYNTPFIQLMSVNVRY